MLTTEGRGQGGGWEPRPGGKVNGETNAKTEGHGEGFLPQPRVKSWQNSRALGSGQSIAPQGLGRGRHREASRALPLFGIQEPNQSLES